MELDNNQQTFIALVKAGLWEQEVELKKLGEIDFEKVSDLAEEQSVIGLVTAGLEQVKNMRVPHEVLLHFIGQTLQIEQRNNAMNHFIAKLVERMRREGIYTLLVKGQGIAQCYRRPEWRISGDVDFFLSDENYKNAIDTLGSMAKSLEQENKRTKHIGMIIDNWDVELHGSLRSELFTKIDKVLDQVKDDIIHKGNVRSWICCGTYVFLPGINNDVMYVFSHILQHYFKEGIGLRQICDWCRLLWTYRNEIDVVLLKKRLTAAGIMAEWKAFGALTVDYLGMPADAMPLYSSEPHWSQRAEYIMSFILETGNFGYNRDTSYRLEKKTIKRKLQTFFHITTDNCRQFFIFPLNSIRVWWRMMMIGLRVV